MSRSESSTRQPTPRAPEPGPTGPMAPEFSRYVAIGDSFTEGVGDPDPTRPNGCAAGPTGSPRSWPIGAGTSATPTSRSAGASSRRSSPSSSTRPWPCSPTWSRRTPAPTTSSGRGWTSTPSPPTGGHDVRRLGGRRATGRPRNRPPVRVTSPRVGPARLPRPTADVAQLVERDLPKVDVASSNLVIRSMSKSICQQRSRVPRRSARLLRRPRARQHQVVLGGAQARLRRGRARARCWP